MKKLLVSYAFLLFHLLHSFYLLLRFLITFYSWLNIYPKNFFFWFFCFFLGLLFFSLSFEFLFYYLGFFLFFCFIFRKVRLLNIISKLCFSKIGCVSIWIVLLLFFLLYLSGRVGLERFNFLLFNLLKFNLLDFNLLKFNLFGFNLLGFHLLGFHLLFSLAWLCNLDFTLNLFFSF